MGKDVRLSLAFDLIVALVILAISSRITEWKWTIVYSFMGFTIPLLFQLVYKFDELLSRYGRLPNSVARRVAKHDIFKTTSITQDLLSIMEKEDRLFIGIALDKVNELQTCLTKLRNMEHRAVGEEVFDIYSALISELENGDEYFATTYVDDYFWKERGAEKFFKCNEDALLRGAKITRVFLYSHPESPESQNDFDSYSVVQQHLQLKKRLGDKSSNLVLKKFDISKADPSREVAEDKGILRDKYVMNLNGSVRSGRKEAIISIDKRDIHDEKRRFGNLLGHGELEPVESAASETNNI